MLVTMLGQTRVCWAMARDGLLPAWTAAVHPRFRTPWLATIATGAGCALAAALTPITVLGQLVSIGTLFAFVVVSLGVLVLRRTRPDLPRPFRVPFVPWLPLAAALVCVLLMTGLPLATWLRLFAWLLLGIVLYAARARQRRRAGPV
jgi:APA family basic amino acid/polyamine antiporter